MGSVTAGSRDHHSLTADARPTFKLAPGSARKTMMPANPFDFSGQTVLPKGIGRATDLVEGGQTAH